MKGVLRFVPFAVTLGLLLQAAPANATFVSAELRVNGISCPFCAFGIEKKLLDVDGVQGIEVFLDDGRITLTFLPDNTVTVSDLERAVEKAGFEIAALRLRVRGHLVSSEEGGALLLASAGMRFRLVEESGKKTAPLSTTTLERLRESAGLGGSSVVVAGAVEDRDEEEPTLVVEFVDGLQR